MPRTRDSSRQHSRNPRMKAHKKRAKVSAYRSTKKKQMVNAMRPMVETKSRTAEEVALAAISTEIVDPTDYGALLNEDAITQIPQIPFNTMTQGLNEDEMIGLSCYARWLKCKLQIKLPSGVNAIQHPADLYCVHGWVKAPLAKTGHTAVTPNNVSPNTINSHVAQHVKDFLDEREDKLRFIPKQNTNIKILGYKRLKPNRNGALGTPVGAFGTTIVSSGYKTVGGNPIINYSVTWKIMRKIHYTHGKVLNGTYKTLFPNASWLPFCVLYNPTFSEFASADAARIEVASNSCLWYSDQ
jgi:thiol-disulfide isomerase/thioredoxin